LPWRGCCWCRAPIPRPSPPALISQSIGERDLDLEAVQSAFGAELALLLRGIERAGRIDKLTAAGVDPEQLRKMLLAIAEDVRVVLIKIAERVVYLRSLTRAEEAVKRAAGRDTLELFGPLANRLGVSEMKWELEDYSFRFTEPDLYHRIARMLDEKRSEREAYIQRVIATLRGELDAIGIKAEIQGRPKHIYSIWRKMRGKDVPFERLYDIRAVRVIVGNVRECYTVLGIVHDRWTPVEGEFDDYIASPKANDYKSLHTAVVGPEGKTLEVQIRTADMHAQSEHGVAGPLALQGRQQGRPQVRRQDRVAAPGAGVEERAGGRRAARLRRHDLRAHAAGPRGRPARGSTPDRLRLPRAHRPRPPLPRRQGRRPDGAARLQAAERPARRDHGGQAGRALARLALAPAGLSRQPARARQGAPVVPPRGLRARRAGGPGGARARAAAPGRDAGLARARGAGRRLRQARRLLRRARPRRGDLAPGRDRGPRRGARAGGSLPPRSWRPPPTRRPPACSCSA
jgi:hypothetical protein